MSDDSAAPPRKILHIDMDAFYASVEQRDNPELRGKPLAVGGSAKRGVVAAASYEARRFGVRSAMPGVTARRRCPELLFVKPRFDAYREVSQQIHAIFARYSDVIERCLWMRRIWMSAMTKRALAALRRRRSASATIFELSCR
jgi:DNA polymerase-4